MSAVAASVIPQALNTCPSCPWILSSWTLHPSSKSRSHQTGNITKPVSKIRLTHIQRLQKTPAQGPKSRLRVSKPAQRPTSRLRVSKPAQGPTSRLRVNKPRQMPISRLRVNKPRQMPTSIYARHHNRIKTPNSFRVNRQRFPKDLQLGAFHFLKCRAGNMIHMNTVLWKFV